MEFDPIDSFWSSYCAVLCRWHNSKISDGTVIINPKNPLGAGGALARHVGLKPDLQSIDFVGAALANEQFGIKAVEPR